MGYQKGDVILELNDELVNIGTVQAVIESFMANTKKGDEVKVKIKRGDEELLLSAPAVTTKVVEAYDLSFMDDITEQQNTVREKWLGAE
jgi:S1-C subfamily serine protease